MLNYPLCLDNIVFNLQRAGGISVYWKELLARMDSADKRLVILERHGAAANIFRRCIDPGRPLKREGGRLPVPLARYLPVSAGVRPPALFHSSYYRVPWNRDIATVVTVHDFTYERFRPPGPARAVHVMQKGAALKRADGIICVSESTRNDLLDRYPELVDRLIRVIYHGVSDEFFQLEPEDGHPLPFRTPAWKRFLVFIGGRVPYKNFPLAVRAAAKLPDCGLIVVGGGKLADRDRRLLEDGLSGRYVHMTGIDNRTLNLVYNRAFALVYPSSYEGFGIPVVEAMRAGCPVVAVRGSSIPEAAGDAGLLVDSPDVDAVVAELLRLEDLDFRNKVVARGLANAARFSWERCHRETMAFYRDVFRRRYGLPLFGD